VAEYTIELRDIVKENGVTQDNSIIFRNFPINDESYRTILQDKIIKHFYFREIGFETIGRFIFELDTRMNEIMPVYNKIYETEKLKVRILDNYDVTEDYTRKGSNEGESVGTGKSDTNDKNNSTGSSTDNNITDTTSDNDNLHIISDTPQGEITFASTGYASELTKDTIKDIGKNTSSGDSTSKSESTNVNGNTNSSKNNSTGSNTETWLRHMVGNIGVQNDSTAIQVYRDSLINVDLMIIAELNDLFMGVY